MRKADLSQVHRDGSVTGDAVQLNVFHDTSHFRVGERVKHPVGKVWGPWLWYLVRFDYPLSECYR